DDLVVGTAVAGRTHPRTEGLIGFFVNTLALRCVVSGDESLLDLLARVRRTTLDAYEHQELPFDRLVDELGVERSLSMSPLAQTMFVLQNAPASAIRLGDLDVRFSEPDTEAAKLDLVVLWKEEADGVSVCWNYSAALFDRPTIERLY